MPLLTHQPYRRRCLVCGSPIRSPRGAPSGVARCPLPACHSLFHHPSASTKVQVFIDRGKKHSLWIWRSTSICHSQSQRLWVPEREVDLGPSILAPERGRWSWPPLNSTDSALALRRGKGEGARVAIKSHSFTSSSVLRPFAHDQEKTRPAGFLVPRPNNKRGVPAGERPGTLRGNPGQRIVTRAGPEENLMAPRPAGVSCL